MSHYTVNKLQSKFEVIEVLESFLKQNENFEAGDDLQEEWRVISSHIEKKLILLGRDGWDFVLMDWPADVPVFNVTINKASLSSALSVDSLVDLLATLDLFWCIRVECLNRIQNNLMVGGDYLRDILVTKDKVYVWESEAAK